MKKQAGALLSSIHIDRGSNRKIGVQLYMGLRDIILSGGLSAGDRLPATRTLAKELMISRTTVIDAIDRLTAEGILVSRVGAGTFVSDILEHKRPILTTSGLSGKTPEKPRISHAISHAADVYGPRTWLPHTPRAFVTALPALDAFPMAHWSRISARHLRSSRAEVMGYGQPQGHKDLRRAIASHLNASRGIKAYPEQIFITSGAQQAFSLIARILLNAGDRVWYENPGATGVRNAFIASGAQLVPVPVDSEGLNVAEGLAKEPHFRLAFVTPSHQQPLGHTMSIARKLALLEAANEAQAIIVEDDYDGEFYFGELAQPPLKSIDTYDRVIYVGTFSKTLFPSLRLGFILAPQNLVSIFDQVFSSWISGPPTSTQAIVADFMDEGQFATHIRLMRKLYKTRYEELMDASQSLPETIKVQQTTSGFHTTAYLDKRVNIDEVIAQAAEKGVTIAPISRYCLQPIAQNGLVLGFGSTNPSDIQASLNILGSLPALHK
jgi:GntR family transcriptional regulator/MocR family aminotransferase